MTKVLSLSLAQQQIWLDQQSYPNSPHFNVGGIGFIDGEVDTDLMQRALVQLVDEHQALRLLPHADGQQTLVDSWPHTLLEIKDFSDEVDANLAMRQWWQEVFLRQIPIDGKTCPWSMALIKQAPNKYGLMAKFHHLVMDGYAVALTFRLYSEIYNQMGKSAASSEQPKRSSRDYVEFIEQSTEYCQSKAFKTSQAFWQQTVPQLPPPHLEPKYQHDQNSGLANANHHIYKVQLDLFAQYEQLAKSHKVTAYHLYIAALAIYFCRIHHKQSIVIGLPVLNRGGKRYKDTLGMFVTVIPIALEFTGQTLVSDLLADISAKLRQSYRHSSFPLSQTVQDLDMIKQGQSRLFDVILSFEVQDFQVEFGKSPLIDTRQYFSPIARYPLAVSVCIFYSNAPVEVVLESSSEYFTMAQTAQLGERLQVLMAGMLQSCEGPVASLPMLGKTERKKLIYGNHQQISDNSELPNVLFWFEHFAAWQGQNVALKWQGGQLDYTSLNILANRFAHYLQSTGACAGDVLLLLMPRRWETIVAMLACLKLRCAFVPADVNSTPERLAVLLQSSGAKWCLTASESRDRLSLKSDCNAVAVDEFCANNHFAAQSPWPDSNLVDKPNSDDLAYILFTSGSTGTPKGVQMTHGPLARRMKWVGRKFDFGVNDCWLQTIQLTFDPSLIEIFTPLTHGASIALPPAGVVAPQDMLEHIEAYNASCVIFVPTTMNIFTQHIVENKLNGNVPSWRITVCGGELLTRDLAEQFSAMTQTKLYNFYGPTEACIFATVGSFNRKHLDSQNSAPNVPIGDAVDDTRIYIVDDKLELLPFGEVGQIAIGGEGLSIGYLQDEDKTAAKFVDDTITVGSHGKLYLTGDNGYWDDNGQLQFIGRIDNQLKLHGQRVEAGDIEKSINAIDAVQMTAVKKVDGKLYAWVVLNPQYSLGASALEASASDDNDVNSHLKQMLTDMMPLAWLPEHIFVVDCMPKQTSGKLDYSQLKVTEKITPAASEQESFSAETVAPRTDLEKLLFALYAKQLSVETLSIHSDFFATGGDSLKALSLLSELNKALDIQLTLSTVVNNSSIAKLASAIGSRELDVLVPLNSLPNATTIYIAASGHGDMLRFAPLAEALAGVNCQLVMLQPPLNQSLAPFTTTEQLGACYASIIAGQTHQGPIVVAGFSVAGNAAIETCRALKSSNIAVKKLVLIDSSYPRKSLRMKALWKMSRFVVNKLHLNELSINRRTLGTLFGDEGLNAQVYALSDYRPQMLDIDSQLVISSGFTFGGRWLFRPWRKVFDKLDEQVIAGFHGTLFDRENVKALAKIISS